jgi:hypothetical protein
MSLVDNPPVTSPFSRSGSWSGAQRSQGKLAAADTRNECIPLGLGEYQNLTGGILGIPHEYAISLCRHLNAMA